MAGGGGLLVLWGEGAWASGCPSGPLRLRARSGTPDTRRAFLLSTHSTQESDLCSAVTLCHVVVILHLSSYSTEEVLI